MIYSCTDADLLLGCLMQDTNLCLSRRYPISKLKDFKPKKFHHILYSTIYNLAISGVKECTEVEIREFLEKYPTYLNTFEDTDGKAFVRVVKELANKDNFEYYYNNVRKCTLLREYIEKGYSVKEIWDEEKSDEINRAELDKWTIMEICNHFEKGINSIRKEFVLKNKVEEMICGDGFDDILDLFEDEPMVGAGLCSPSLNAMYLGWCRGHLILRGSPSSFGKTTMGISDQVNSTCLKIWSDEYNDFIDNPYYQGLGAYIHTEQNMEKEIQPRFASTVAKIPYNMVLSGAYRHDKAMRNRLSEAGRILKQSELRLINDATFSSSELRERIRDLSINGYQYITHDYIWANGDSWAELKKIQGNVREDQVILDLANTLKLSAEEFNVGVATMVQTNGKEEEMELVNEGCLFGSRSIKTKLDCGSVYMRPKLKELKKVEMLIARWNQKNKAQGKGIKPNAVSHVFKARYSQYGKDLKVWHYVDNSTGTMTDMFVTDWQNNPIEGFKPLYIERK